MSTVQRSCETAVSVRLHSTSRRLEVEWTDDTRSIFTHAELRCQCKCATCEQARRSGRAVAQAADVSISDITAAGPAALRLHFSDGHDRGIYPFAYLRQLASMTI